MNERHNWAATIKAGVEMAAEQTRSDVDVREHHVMWALLRDAASVSGRAYPAPPRTGWPSKSAMPDAPDDVSQWQMMMAYIQGQVEDAPSVESKPPMPSAEQVTRSEIILHIWHHHALRDRGGRHRIKKAVYLKACGVSDRRVRAVTGFTRQAIHAAKDAAMQDMWDVIRRY